MATKIYRDLIVWQRAMDLVEEVYTATKEFPKEELYGLTSQLRRAVVSIPSNIAEGQGRNSPKEFVQFLAIAYGSLREAETQILIAERLRYLDSQHVINLMNLAGEVGRLLNGLSKSLTPPNHQEPQPPIHELQTVNRELRTNL
jgi:four helix bundle protein